MKNPWVVFAGMCSLVIGIVIICVIFGGYSSFLRSKSRIEAARGLLVEHSRKQVGQADTLPELQGVVIPDFEALKTAAATAGQAIGRLEKAAQPVDAKVIAAYETAQTRYNQILDQIRDQTMGKMSSAPDQNPTAARTVKQIKAFQTALLLSARQYNKETRYFNTRIQMFPGFLVARLFSLDKLHFNELSPRFFNDILSQGVPGAA